MNSPTIVTAVWDNIEQTILRFDYGSHWTWAEAHKARLQSEQMIEVTTHQKPIGAIMVPPSGYIPPNILSGAKEEMLALHPRIVVITLVSDSMFIRSLFNVFLRIVPALRAKYRIVATLEDARKLIRDDLAKRSAVERDNSAQVAA